MTHGETQLLGRRELENTVLQLLRLGRSVMLVGPSGVGKTALIQAISPPEVFVVDPFERIGSRRAAHIRRSMDRNGVWIAAARARERLGHVGRIAWRFEVVRVPPLSVYWMRRLISRSAARAGLEDAITADWLRDVVRLSAGLPGRAVDLVNRAALTRARGRPLTAPATLYLDAAIPRDSPTPPRR
ncbi:MAG TPA: hypothetical protein VG871_15980 [Vicinamibacterales bacterium]|nr:hypothetical protein [Vicinamibacterales bacterium]